MNPLSYLMGKIKYAFTHEQMDDPEYIVHLLKVRAELDAADVAALQAEADAEHFDPGVDQEYIANDTPYVTETDWRDEVDWL